MKKTIEVANCFIASSEDFTNNGQIFSNLHVQKVLYLAQGFFLACDDEPIFKEDIEAWEYGPVVPDAYRYFEQYGNLDIPKPEHFPFYKFSKEKQRLLDDIYRNYGKYSAWVLKEITTNPEGPWARTFEAGKRNVISHELLKEYFLTLVE